MPKMSILFLACSRLDSATRVASFSLFSFITLVAYFRRIIYINLCDYVVFDCALFV